MNEMSTGTVFRADHPRVQGDDFYWHDTSDSEWTFVGHDDRFCRLVISRASGGLMDLLSSRVAAQIKAGPGQQEIGAMRYHHLAGMAAIGKRTEMNTDVAEYRVAAELLSETVHQPNLALSGAHTIYWFSEPIDLSGYVFTGLERTGGIVYVDTSATWWGAPTELVRGIAESGTVGHLGYDTFRGMTNTYATLAEDVGVRQWVSLETEAAPEAHSSDETDASELHPIAVEFSLGVHGEPVGTDLVNKVDRIIKALIAGTSDAEYSVDEDGAVSFEATLSSGLFIMCEVSLAGNINAGLYDGADGGLERFLTRPTEADLLGLI